MKNKTCPNPTQNQNHLYEEISKIVPRVFLTRLSQL
jgi:hypothetical protein